MNLDDLVYRASWLSTVANRAQWVCRDSQGFYYVTDAPKYLDDVIRVVRPSMKWPLETTEGQTA